MNSLIKFLFFLCLFSFSLAQTYKVVPTEYGSIRGFCNENGTFFFGVPFAKPPVGDLRWKMPQPPAHWDGVLDTLAPSPVCIQPTAYVSPGLTMNEDCLYLNIYVPPTDKKSHKPKKVMFWIYGGSFVDGSGIEYDGTNFAKNYDVIFVNFNYRLNIFGFLALEQLLNESSDAPTTGNYGFQDQRLALKWVKKNIRNFGGDPNDIMIFGESAGAISICGHLASPRASGLFSSALMESGYCNFETLDYAIEQGNLFLGYASYVCPPNSGNLPLLEYLRALPAECLLYGFEYYFENLNIAGPTPPVIDGYEFTQQPIESLKSGRFNKVPVVIGTNMNEFSYFICSTLADITADEYPAYIEYFLGANLVESVLQLYPVTNYPSPVNALSAALTDYKFFCSSKQAANAISRAGVPTYMYSFQHVPSFSLGNCYGAAHSFELPFVFPTFISYYELEYGGGQTSWTSAEEKLALFMQKSWATFAKEHKPGFFWPRYFPNGPYIILDTPFSYGFNQQGHCDFWDQVVVLSNTTKLF